MNAIRQKIVFGSVIVSAFLLGSVPQARADIFDDAQEAIDQCDKATKDAQANTPGKTVRDAENKLDQAEQKLDDVNAKTNPPATDKEKQDAQDARDQAKADADEARQDTEEHPKADDFTKQFDNYRDALKRRREACKKLKNLIPSMDKEVKSESSAKESVKSTYREEEDKQAHKSKLQKARSCVKKCGEPPSLAMVMPGMTPGGGTFATFVSNGQVAVNIAGTGETIGPVALMIVENLTDQPIDFAIPPAVLESRSGKNQDYVIPHGENVALKPHESKTIPMDGVCVNRHKPPVGKGVDGDLVLNDGHNRDAHSHIAGKDADRLLRICSSKYDAADKLQKDGKLKDLPYHDKEKQKEIVVQWSTWTDPRISEIEGGPPATKDDLKKVVEKQVGNVPPDEKKKIDKGIDTIFDKIELTTAKAKDLEEPPVNEEVESPPIGGGAINVTNDTPTPAPQTTEKPKERPKLSEPLRKWLEKKKAAELAWKADLDADRNYFIALSEFCLKNKTFKQVYDQYYEVLATVTKAGEHATEQDKKELERLGKRYGEIKKKLEGDFLQTDAGRTADREREAAKKALDKADAAEEEAGKYLDPDAKHDAWEAEKDAQSKEQAAEGEKK